MIVELVVGGALVAITGVAYNEFLFRRKHAAMNNVLSQMSQEIVLLEEIDSFSAKIKNIIIKHMDAINVSIILYSDEKSAYRFMNPEDMQKGITNFDQYKLFYLYLETHGKTIHKRILRDKKLDEATVAAAQKYFQDTDAEVCVPLIFERRLIGVINLEKRKNHKRYTHFDIELLERIKNSITVGFTNSLLFAKMSKLFEEEEEQNRELKELAKAKSAFIANISHELRTPLVAARGYTEYILSEKFGKLTQKQKKGLEISFNNLTRLQNLINSLLLYTQIQAGKVHVNYENINLSYLINECIEEQKLIAEKKGLELSYSGPKIVNVEVDFDKIKQVFLNLIANAIKFTEKGKVHINVETKDKKVIVRVSDTGIGIPKERIDYIFDRFTQVDESVERRYGGTGLGLSIVKSILEMHGSKISVESKLEEGTTFYFELDQK
ncbi:MAG: ATP-binding protein [Candidatus Woesearchaeota archaeon]